MNLWQGWQHTHALHRDFDDLVDSYQAEYAERTSGGTGTGNRKALDDYEGRFTDVCPRAASVQDGTQAVPPSLCALAL